MYLHGLPTFRGHLITPPPPPVVATTPRAGQAPIPERACRVCVVGGHRVLRAERKQRGDELENRREPARQQCHRELSFSSLLLLLPLSLLLLLLSVDVTLLVLVLVLLSLLLLSVDVPLLVLLLVLLIAVAVSCGCCVVWMRASDHLRGKLL